MNMTQQAHTLGITLDARLSNEPAPESWPPGTRRWDCTLTYNGRTMRVPYHMGPALKHEPTIGELLSVLASDSASYDNARSFEEWANEYDYDTDSRAHERTYRSIGKQRNELAELLGDEYGTIVYQTEGE